MILSFLVGGFCDFGVVDFGFFGFLGGGFGGGFGFLVLYFCVFWIATLASLARNDERGRIDFAYGLPRSRCLLAMTGGVWQFVFFYGLPRSRCSLAMTDKGIDCRASLATCSQ